MRWTLQQRWTRNRRLNISATVLLVAVTGCVTGNALPADSGRLTIENESLDVIQVFLDLGDHELTLGRVGSLQRESLRVPSSAFSMFTRNVRIRVVHIGSPMGRAARQYSEWYAGEDVIRGTWRYTGSRILWVGSRRVFDLQ